MNKSADWVRRISAPRPLNEYEDRGTLVVGTKADVLVFTPEAVKATATWAEPRQHPEGFDYIIVNGRVAVASGELADESFGRVLHKQKN